MPRAAGLHDDGRKKHAARIGAHDAAPSDVRGKRGVIGTGRGEHSRELFGLTYCQIVDVHFALHRRVGGMRIRKHTFHRNASEKKEWLSFIPNDLAFPRKVCFPAVMKNPGLEKAKAVIGGNTALAQALGGLTPQAVSQWRRIPAERTIDVERITGVSRHELRPDLYPDAPGKSQK